MAPKYFCRVFHQITGRTPINYLNYYRVECAAELLRSTDDSITEIAFACGFNDSCYFSKHFFVTKQSQSQGVSQEASVIAHLLRVIPTV